MREARRSSTSTIAPCLRPRLSTPTMLSSTRSPCITLRISAGRNVDIVAAAVGPQETEAFGVGDDRAGNQVEFLRDAIAATPVLQQLAIAQHCRETLGQRLEVARIGQVKFLRQRFGGQQLRALAERRGSLRGSGSEVRSAASRVPPADRAWTAQPCAPRARPAGRSRAGPCGFLRRPGRQVGHPARAFRRRFAAWILGFYSVVSLTEFHVMTARRVADMRRQCKPRLTTPGALSIVRGPCAMRRLAPLARVAELVDALASGVSDASRGGSSPLPGTIYPD